MIHTLKHPYGIDEYIQEIQESLYVNLKIKWNTDKIDAYGRIYKNEKDGETIPEVFDKELQGYKSAYYNDRSCFFFVDSNIQKGNGHDFQTELTIVFMLNMKDIYKDEKERVDERVFTDVTLILRESFEGVFTIENHLKELKNVLKEFGISKIQENDLQPLHVFSIKGQLEYFINDNCE